jgi:hypothetical protein
MCGGNAEDLDRLKDWLSRRTENRLFLVEAMVDAVASPNIQLHVSADGSTECVGITDQLLDAGLTHCGDASPSQARCIRDMVRCAHLLADWLGDMGYTGIAGFEFVEYINEDGNRRAFLAELNPRVNGATYPLAVRERISPRSALVSGSVFSGVGSFDEVGRLLSDLLYSPAGDRGILPHTTGSLAYDTCGIIALAPSRPEAAELFAEAELRLSAAALPVDPVSCLAGIR